MKGIILAGGTGTRLHPADAGDLQAAAAGLRQADDLLSAVGADAGRHPRHPDHHHAAGPCRTSRRCSATGAQWGIAIRLRRAAASPKVWRRPSSSARDFVGGDRVALGARRQHLLRPRPDGTAAAARTARESGATVFAYQVDDPERYGVVDFDQRRPRHLDRGEAAAPQSNWAVTGLYFYDNRRVDIASERQAVARAASWRSPTSTAPISSGRAARRANGRGYAWLDTGTHDCLLEAGEFVRHSSSAGLPSAARKRLRSEWAMSRRES